jgi:uncharacterized protein (DUF1810 family)
MIRRPGTNVADPLQRFVDAQAPVYAVVLDELRAGRKATHWMWFVFPQLAGLGSSAMAQRYALGDRAEAVAYLAHPLLGRRLLDCLRLVLDACGDGERTPREVFGTPDDLKLCSCLTLFEAVGGGQPFTVLLERCFAGRRDVRTLALLDPASPR